MIPFLSLKQITDKYSSEIHEAVARVIDSGWYLQGVENEKFETVTPSGSVVNIQLAVQTVWSPYLDIPGVQRTWIHERWG